MRYINLLLTLTFDIDIYIYNGILDFMPQLSANYINIKSAVL